MPEVLRRLRPRLDDRARQLLAPAQHPAAQDEPPTRYVAHPGAAGATVLVPRGDDVLLRQVQRDRPATPRAAAVRAVRSLLPRQEVRVPPGVPAVVAAALPDRVQGRCCLVVGGGGPRRRPAFLVADRQGPADAVVKVAPAHALDGRAAREQDVLRQVEQLAPRLGPRPLGLGVAASWAWSSETLVPGRPLSETVTDTTGRGRLATAAVLEDLAAGLGALAVPGPPVAGHDGLVRLAGRHRALQPLLAEVAAIPRVLVHGDLASAHNVLVEGRSARLIDWETAHSAGLPLLDLLPVLCLSAARAAGHTDPGRQLDHVLDLCAGRGPRSRWLLDLVTRYCERIGVPLALAGRLAVLSWGHVASMPAVHAQLAQHDGQSVPVWTTPADAVAGRWLQDGDLGLSWPALDATRRP